MWMALLVLIMLWIYSPLMMGWAPEIGVWVCPIRQGLQQMSPVMGCHVHDGCMKKMTLHQCSPLIFLCPYFLILAAKISFEFAPSIHGPRATYLDQVSCHTHLWPLCCHLAVFRVMMLAFLDAYSWNILLSKAVFHAHEAGSQYSSMRWCIVLMASEARPHTGGLDG